MSKLSMPDMSGAVNDCGGHGDEYWFERIQDFYRNHPGAICRDIYGKVIPKCSSSAPKKKPRAKELQ